ncbi:MAG: hypothetical protein RJB26_2108 [Pseudomonadota bacterium]|jgi:SAM-dependent methyltransferase
MTPYNPHGDLCLSIFADVYATGALVFPPNARVLEIGCAEADWQTPMLALRPDLQITGVDWRKAKRPGTTIQGDILTQDFAPGSFDVVVGISSIEHIGLGHYEADPKYLDGDVTCMADVAQWLAPGGWAYLDIPYNAAGYEVLNTEARIYDDRALAERLTPLGLREAGRWYADRSGRFLGTTAPEPRPAHSFDYVALLLTR